MFGVPYLH